MVLDFKNLLRRKKREAYEAPSLEPKVSRETEILKEAEVEKEKPLEKEISKEKIPQKVVLPPKAPKPAEKEVPLLAKSETRCQIEKILSEGLEEVYFSLSEAQKQEFKRKGEETASKIEKLMMAVKVKVKKVLGLIRDWLKIIPGVNKFFLEQESKIKTDKILDLREREE